MFNILISRRCSRGPASKVQATKRPITLNMMLHPPCKNGGLIKISWRFLPKKCFILIQCTQLFIPFLSISDSSLFSNEFPARTEASLTCSSSSNSLQHIIDKYTKELDISLRSVHTGTGNQTHQCYLE